jgi:4'-phosphopantetheinyl transferase
VVLVDGKIPKGWQFTKFELYDGQDLYQGVTAEFVGGNRMEFLSPNAGWLVRQKAECFVQQAIQELE